MWCRLTRSFTARASESLHHARRDLCVYCVAGLLHCCTAANLQLDLLHHMAAGAANDRLGGGNGGGSSGGGGNGSGGAGNGDGLVLRCHTFISPMIDWIVSQQEAETSCNGRVKKILHMRRE